MKNLDSYGVQMLDTKEIKEIGGGGFLAWLVGAVEGVVKNGVDGLKHSNIHKGTGLVVGQKW